MHPWMFRPPRHYRIDKPLESPLFFPMARGYQLGEPRKKALLLDTRQVDG
jgi:hypothetical protein